MSRTTRHRAARDDSQHFAFISYSHKQKELAQALKRSLEGFAKKWNRRKVRRVFLDEASLPTGASLENSVLVALESSASFILLASPEAKRSVWVNRELADWVSRNGTRDLFLVLADGDIVWDRAAGRFDPVRSTALPDALVSAYAEEPLWEDLRALDGKTQQDRLLSVTAGVISAMSGTAKEELYGEDIRQQRFVKRLAITVAAVMALLGAGLVGTSVVAIHQRDIAQANGTTASAHALAARSKTLLQSRTGSAIRLALDAHELRDDLYTRAALVQGLAYDPHLVRMFRVHAFINGITWDEGSADVLVWGRTFVAVSDPSTGALRYLPSERNVSTIQCGPAGSAIAALGTRTGDVRLVSERSGSVLWSTHVFGAPVDALAFSPDGSFVAAASGDDDVAILARSNGDSVRVRNLSTTALEASRPILRFASSGGLLVADATSQEWLRLAVPGLQTERGGRLHPHSPGVGATFLVSGPDGDSIAHLGQGRVTTSAISGDPPKSTYPPGLPPQTGARTMSSDGQLLAVERNGTATVYTARATGAAPTAPVQLPGAATLGSQLAISPNKAMLASSYGRAVAVWNIFHYGGIAHSLPIQVPVRQSRSAHPVILSDSAAGTTIVMSGSGGGPSSPSQATVSCWQGVSRRSGGPLDLPAHATTAAWSHDHDELLVAATTPTRIVGFPLVHGCPAGTGHVVFQLGSARARPIVQLATLADSSLLALNRDGVLSHLDAGGRKLQSWGRQGVQPRVTAVSVSPDGSAVLIGQANGGVQENTLLNGALVHRWTEHSGSGRVASVVFLSPTVVAASRGEGNVDLFDPESGSKIKGLGGAQGFILCSVDNGALLLGTQPGYGVAVWDGATGVLMTQLAFTYPTGAGIRHAYARQAVTTAVASTHDGHVWFAAPGSSVTRWDFNVSHWNAFGCDLLVGIAAVHPLPGMGIDSGLPGFCDR